MADEFDPYLHWLGIRDSERPPNHYRLLGLELFESDPDVIATAADRQMAHVRTFQSGKRAELSQRLLNELSAAKICLLQEPRKAEYDQLLADSMRSRVSDTTSAAHDDSRESELPDSSDFESPFQIEAAEPTFQLRRPRRGRRSTLGRRIVLVTMFVLLAAVPAFLHFRGRRPGPAFERPDPPDTTSAPNGAAQDVSPTLTTGPSTAPTTPNEATADASSVDPPQRLQEPVTVPRADSKPPTPEPAPWDRPVKPPWKPFQFSGASPLSEFVLALANRNTKSARALLDNKIRPATTMEAHELDSLDLFLWTHERFWNMVEKGVSHVRQAETVEYRGAPMILLSRDGTSLTFQAKNRTRKSFSIDRGQMDSELAIALAQAGQRQSLPSAWSAIGCFLLIDKQGDTRQAELYLSRAERHGVSTESIRHGFHIITRETGIDVGSDSNDFAIMPD
jgi:hypothetical protein